MNNLHNYNYNLHCYFLHQNYWNWTLQWGTPIIDGDVKVLQVSYNHTSVWYDGMEWQRNGIVTLHSIPWWEWKWNAFAFCRQPLMLYLVLQLHLWKQKMHVIQIGWNVWWIIMAMQYIFQGDLFHLLFFGTNCLTWVSCDTGQGRSIHSSLIYFILESRYSRFMDFFFQKLCN